LPNRPRLRRHGYLQSLPPREYIPIFWSREELRLLQGTELEGRAQDDLCAAAPARRAALRGCAALH
jgi:hypothetical protein